MHPAVFVLWSSLVAVAWTHRPRRHRLSIPPSGVAWVVGGAIRRVFGLGPDHRSAQLLGRGLIGAGLLAAFSPGLAVGAVGLGIVWPTVEQRRKQRELRAAVARELPEVIDILRLALSTTGSIVSGVTLAAEAVPGPLGAALRRAAHRAERELFADALLAEGSSLTPAVEPLFRTLAGAERYGVEIEPALDRLAGEARRQRRRNAETAARQIPVRLLLPLVGCVLPAFVLLTLVPVLARTLLSIDTGG